MRTFFGILLLVLSSTAFAQERYDVSCQNVAKIEIIRVKDTYWNVGSYHGCFHVLYLELQQNAARAFVELQDDLQVVCKRYRGDDHYAPDIIITANGVPIRNDAPAMTTYLNEGISILIVHEEDAFAAARSVCPALVPDRVLIDGQLEDPRAGEE